MKSLGGEQTIIQQTLVLGGSIGVITFTLLFLLFDPSWDGFFLFMPIATLCVVVNYINLKLYEVYFTNEKILFKNLLASIEMDRKDFENVKKTAFSPHIFKIMKGSKTFYFSPRSASVFSSLEVGDSILKELNESMASLHNHPPLKNGTNEGEL